MSTSPRTLFEKIWERHLVVPETPETPAVVSARSEMSAASKLAAQVRRKEKWIALDSAVFSATDFATYGASSNERTLLIDATAYK